MALRGAYGGAQAVRAQGLVTGWFGTRTFGETGTANAYPASMYVRMHSIAALLRPNNDGPGWTKNLYATTPDLYRPIPFKAVSTASLPHRSTAWRMLIHLLLPLL